MNSVWILIGHEFNDGLITEPENEILGVYASKDVAQDSLRVHTQSYGNAGWIEEHEVRE